MWDPQLAQVARSKPIYPALFFAIQAGNNKTKQQQLLAEILGTAGVPGSRPAAVTDEVHPFLCTAPRCWVKIRCSGDLWKPQQ